MKRIVTHSVEETESVGRALAEALAQRNKGTAFVALYGDLGAGKTAFTRGFVEKFSPGSRVKSPTYTIVNEYRKGSVPVFHFDLYRVGDAEELIGIGFDEYVSGGICITEWSENLGKELPAGAIQVRIIKSGSAEERTIEIDGIEWTDEG